MKLSPDQKRQLLNRLIRGGELFSSPQRAADVMEEWYNEQHESFSAKVERLNPEELPVRKTGDPVTDQTNEGIVRADEHAQEEWKRHYDVSAHAICVSMMEFTPDDVMKYMQANFPDIETHDRRAAGAGMIRASKAGWCRNTHKVVSSRIPEHHKMRKSVWESLIYAT